MRRMWWELVVVGVAVAVGALVQGAIGFGFALVSAPVLVLFEPAVVPVALLVLAMPLNLTVLWHERTDLDVPGALQVSLGLVVGTALGVLVLRGVPEERLTVVFGAAIVIAGLTVALRPPRRVGGGTRAAAGVGAGMINTVTGTGGPLVALLYSRGPVAVMRSTLAVTFALSVVLSVTGQALAGRLTLQALRWSVALLPALALGLWASLATRARLPEEGLRRAVTVFVIAGGLAAIARGLL